MLQVGATGTQEKEEEEEARFPSIKHRLDWMQTPGISKASYTFRIFRGATVAPREMNNFMSTDITFSFLP
jgi:hypothetical protein